MGIDYYTCESCGVAFDEYCGDGIWGCCSCCDRVFCQSCVGDGYGEDTITLEKECDGNCIKTVDDIRKYTDDGEAVTIKTKKAKFDCECHPNVKKLREENDFSQRVMICKFCLLDYKLVDKDILLDWLLERNKTGYSSMKELCDAYNAEN